MQQALDRVVAEPVQPGGPELDRPVPRPVRQHSTADASAGLDDRDRVSGRLQPLCRGQAGNSGADHDDVLASPQPVVETSGSQPARLVGTVNGSWVGQAQGLAGEDDPVRDDRVGEVGAGGSARSDGEASHTSHAPIGRSTNG